LSVIYLFISSSHPLGITIIEMVDGQPPNTDIDCIEMLPLIATRDPPTLKTPSAFSPEFNNLISCCLKKEPVERYTCQQLLTVCGTQFSLISFSFMHYLFL
jgi:serine/threonine protein kinase